MDNEQKWRALTAEILSAMPLETPRRQQGMLDPARVVADRIWFEDIATALTAANADAPRADLVAATGAPRRDVPIDGGVITASPPLDNRTRWSFRLRMAQDRAALLRQDPTLCISVVDLLTGRTWLSQERPDDHNEMLWSMDDSPDIAQALREASLVLHLQLSAST